MATMRILLSTIVATISIALVPPGVVAAQGAPAGDEAVPPPPRGAVLPMFLQPVEVAPAHRPVDRPARSSGRSSGRGAMVAGAVLLSLGLTSLAVGIAGFATNGYQIVCLLGCSAPDYGPATIFTAVGGVATALGIGLLVLGSAKRENARRGRAARGWVLPTVAGATNGDGLVLGAVGAF